MSTRPTSWMLVGLLFICIIECQASAEQQSNSQEAIDDFQAKSLYSLHQESDSHLGMLQVGGETVYFPWAHSSQSARPALSQSASSGKSEDILMDRNHTTEQVEDMLAVNSIDKRDIRYEGLQKGVPGSFGPVNSQDISVSGEESEGPGQSPAENNGNGPQPGNYLSIDVHDISVSAINTMKGGNAIATSNIIIEPVQIIVCPSEVEEKLK
ncbi:MAG TPA: hypothetical protein PKL29_06660, partial [Methanothrix sp.]|nr:hypothetical protein [Methanothrix sp.]